VPSATGRVFPAWREGQQMALRDGRHFDGQRTVGLAPKWGIIDPNRTSAACSDSKETPEIGRIGSPILNWARALGNFGRCFPRV
jgi:hypothetical protein